jgi:hypothetical protein
MREAVTSLAPLTGTVAACQALGVARPSYYRAEAGAAGSAQTAPHAVAGVGGT